MYADICRPSPAPSCQESLPVHPESPPKIPPRAFKRRRVNKTAAQFKKEYFKKKLECAEFELKAKKILFHWELKIKKKMFANLDNLST